MAGQVEEVKDSRNIIRKTYDVCMEWIATPYGLWALFAIAFVESSFFPIPPDVFLIALCVSVPTRSFKYAAICTVGSVCGGAFGYGLGMWFMDSVGQSILAWYHLAEKYETVRALYEEYKVWIVGTAGFTPLPYKLFTITAGAMKIDFFAFMVVSLVARAGRFFLVAAFIWKFGAPVKKYIDKYFNILSILFMVLLVGGFFALKIFL